MSTEVTKPSAGKTASVASVFQSVYGPVQGGVGPGTDAPLPKPMHRLGLGCWPLAAPEMRAWYLPSSDSMNGACCPSLENPDGSRLIVPQDTPSHGPYCPVH